MTLNQILKATTDRISFNVVLEILCENLQKLAIGQIFREINFQNGTIFVHL